MPQVALVGAGWLLLLQSLWPLPFSPSIPSLVEQFRTPAATVAEALPAPGPVTATLTADLQRQHRFLATQG